MKQVFRTHPVSTFAPSVTKLTFFVSNDGKLYKITTQTSFLEQAGNHTQIWAGNEDPNTEWDFYDASAEDLKRYPFKELALRNPEDFKALYYTLKEHDEKMFPIIHSVLEEVQQIFNFN